MCSKAADAPQTKSYLRWPIALKIQLIVYQRLAFKLNIIMKDGIMLATDHWRNGFLCL